MAGYSGNHAVQPLAARVNRVVVVNDLTVGFRDALHSACLAVDANKFCVTAPVVVVAYRHKPGGEAR